MARLGIETAGEDQHKKRAYCDGESAHSVPQSNLRQLLIARRVAIAAGCAWEVPRSLHVMIAPIERGLGRQRTNGSDQSILEMRRLNGRGQMRFELGSYETDGTQQTSNRVTRKQTAHDFALATRAGAASRRPYGENPQENSSERHGERMWPGAAPASLG
jgi:hypothetical protein